MTQQQESAAPLRVVIVGAGFGGLEATPGATGEADRGAAKAGTTTSGAGAR